MRILTCLSFVFLIIVGFYSCQDGSATSKTGYLKVSGKTMGTTYQVTYSHEDGVDFKNEIDSLLAEINQEVSTYINTSLISTINKGGLLNRGLDSFSPAKGAHFITNFEEAKKIFSLTNGAFDPTVMPLVNYWGFGYTPKTPVTKVDSAKVDSLIRFVGFDNVKINENGIEKSTEEMELDFSAIAKGYGVDAIGRLLEDENIRNYLVEIGGEVRARGVNTRGTPWVIGINTPKEGVAVNEFQTLVQLDDIALATSGNYQNFYEVDGKKYSHTINSKTGFPERNRLLSASVFTTNCMTADGLATAMMVMGVEDALKLANSIEGVEAYLIFSKDNGTFGVNYTEAVESWLK